MTQMCRSRIVVKPMVPKKENKEASLQDVGTRFQHYSDLIELFDSALEIVKQSYKNSPNQIDANRITMLDSAVTCIRKETDRLADWDYKQWGLRQEVEKIGPHPEGYVEENNDAK